MATHKLFLEVKRHQVNYSDVELEIFEDDAKLGELHFSRGSIDWLPKGAHTEYRLPWSRFAQLMEDHGRRVRRRG